MKNSILLLKNTFNQYFVYRLKVVIMYASLLFGLLIQTTIWRAISTSKSSFPYSSTEIIIYFIGVVSLLYIVGNSIDMDIKNLVSSGRIVYFFVKPLSLMKYLFVMEIPKKIVNLIIFTLPLLIILSIFFNISIINILGSVFFSIFSSIFLLLFNYLFGLIILLFKSADAIYWSKVFIVQLASGTLIPLDLLVGPFKILMYLPFKYVLYYPVQVLLEDEIGTDYFIHILIFCIWIVILYVIIFITQKYVFKKIVIFGG